MDAADFELSAALAAWHARMAQAGVTSEARTELEDHLREAFAARVAAGEAPSSAWSAAEQRLGEPGALAREFARVTNPLPDPVTWLGLGYLAVSSLSQATSLLGDFGQILGASYLKRATLECTLFLGLAWLLWRLADRLLARPLTALVALCLIKLALSGANLGLRLEASRLLSVEDHQLLALGGGFSRMAFTLLLLVGFVPYLLLRRRRNRLPAAS